MNLDNLMIYRNFTTDKDILECMNYCLGSSEISEQEFVSLMLSLSEKYNLHHHIFQGLITYVLAYHENVFTLALERKKSISDDLKTLIIQDLEVFYHLFHYSLSNLNPTYKQLITHYQQSQSIKNKEIYDVLFHLQNELSFTNSVDDFYHILYKHYMQYGVGKYGLNKAFRYDGQQIIPILHIGDETLEQLIGYQSQKDKLCANTEAFIHGKNANNVLLYGDSGTGKSTSIKGLLNKYYKDGLRMVEIYKHQFIALPQIINELQNHHYKFIIFMDDLSFEDFEIEYKYLKAVIEGGLEKKPDNILIYATSNRRHLIKETWNERQFDEEINNNDAKQEKLSLVSRFGIQIMYISPDKQNYLKIVNALAKQHQIQLSLENIQELSLQWAIRNGGYSGRVAKQFIYSLIGNDCQ